MLSRCQSWYNASTTLLTGWMIGYFDGYAGGEGLLFVRRMLNAALGIVIALLSGAVIMLAQGYNPLASYAAHFEFALGTSLQPQSYQIPSQFIAMTPYLATLVALYFHARRQRKERDYANA